MDFPTLLERVIVFATVLGGLITAVATVLNSLKQTKESDASVDRSKLMAPIDVAERISTISISLSQTLQQQLDDCISKRDELAKILDEASDMDNMSKVRLRKLASRLRTTREKHDKVYSDLDVPCPGFEVINNMIDSIIEDIEKELEDR